MAQPAEDPRSHADPLAGSTHAESGGSTWKRAGEPAACAPLVSRYEHFEILRREDGTAWTLGSGAMGSTFKAVDTRLHSVVALKVIRSEFLGCNAIGVRRFLREARLAASVHHPNVARVFHLGELADGLCFYAMEFVEGETLAERVRRAGPLSVLAALEITLQVTRALAAAARLDLIHRDIKPANLVLTTAGAAACDAPTHLRSAGAGDSDSSDHPALVKVIDFGLARSVTPPGGESLTVGGDFVGTPAFASPEQVSEDDEPIDGRSDIFSLGATLWFLLTGQQPFAGRTFEETQRLLLRARPVKQLRQAAVPEAVVMLLRTMLAADRAHRPQTPAALVEAIIRCRQEVAVCLPRTSFGGDAAPSHLAPYFRKQKRWAGPVITTLLLLLLLGAAVWWVCLATERRTSIAPLDHPVLEEAMIPANSVAVLPFENQSKDPDNAFFTEGIQDEILTDLANIADLKVISRTSVMQYRGGKDRNLRDISRALGVAHMVEGSVQRVGTRVRVNAQLIDARTDSHRWAEHYDGDLADVFAIQSEIAQKVATQLTVAISAQEHTAMAQAPTHDLKAYELYLRARDKWNDFDNPDNGRTLFAKVIALLTEATTRDPNFVQAFAFLTEIEANRYNELEATPAQDARVLDLARTVARLRPGSGEAHKAAGMHAFHVRRDTAKAITEFTGAVRCLPNDARSWQLLGSSECRQGSWEDGLAHVSHASELDPENVDVTSVHEVILERMGRYREAAAILDGWLAQHPHDDWALISRADTELAWTGDAQTARAMLSRLRADDNLEGRTTQRLLACDACARDFTAADRDLAAYPAAELAFDHPTGPILLPHAYFEACNARYRGDHSAALAAFNVARSALASKVVTRPGDAYLWLYLATVDAALGRRTEAIEEAARGTALRPPEQDAVTGPRLVVMQARVLAWLGQREEAIELLRLQAAKPSGPSPGYLRRHPDWDVLRGEPRFEALVASMVSRASKRER